MIRRVGERQGVREGLGVALYRLAEVHRRRGLRVTAGSARVAVREGKEARGRSWEWFRVPGRERRRGMSYGRAIGAARALAERGSALARATGERGGRAIKWAACWRGADVEGH